MLARGLARAFRGRREASAAPELAVVENAPNPWQGYVDERSRHHVAGWVWQPGNAAVKPVVEVVRGDGSVLARAVADQYSQVLSIIGIGDAHHAYFIAFDAPLAAGEDDRIEVRVADGGHLLPHAPEQRRTFHPISYVALDLVNNCNLRCPFCVYNYEGVNRTDFMEEETFRQALKLLPYVSDANFWMSCLHEPTLHPRLTDFIAMVPDEYRRKIFYTTNMAKRMHRSYFEFLADSGIHHINISIESFDPKVYEKMRKGARADIFRANLDMMAEIFAKGSRPPKVRFSALAYKSNLAELPELVRTTRERYGAWQTEVRATYDVPHISRDFAAEEYLDPSDWDIIREGLSGYSAEEVILVPPQPPETIDPAAPNLQFAPRPYAVSMRQSGHFVVSGPRPAGPDAAGNVMVNYVEANINSVRDPLKFLLSL